jgi:septal ring factor EnvC (AmiA/AmiB activator)
VDRDKKVAACEAKVATTQRDAQQEREKQVDLARRLQAVEAQLEAARIRLDGAEGHIDSTRAMKEDLQRRLDATAQARREVEEQLRVYFICMCVCMKIGASSAAPSSFSKFQKISKKSLTNLVVIYYNLKS